MNSISNNSMLPEDKKTKRLLLSYLLLSSMIIFSVSTFILSPLLVITSSDIIYQNTVIPDILELLISVSDILAYTVCFSIILYSIFRFSLSGSSTIIATYCAVVFIKYTVNIIVSVLFDGSISADDISIVMLYFLIDAVIVFIVSLIGSISSKKFYSSFNDSQKASMYLSGKLALARDKVFPFEKLYSPSNPLQVSALGVGILLAVIKIITRIVFDLFIGVPQSTIDLLWMIAYYVSDILICGVVYLISLLLFIRLYKKDLKKS